MKKKWLIGLTAVLMAVTLSLGFASCAEHKKDYTDEAIAASVLVYVKSQYDVSSKLETPEDYEVVSEAPALDGNSYAVTYTVAAKEEHVAIGDYVKVGESVNGKTKISVTRGEVDVNYSLNASVKVNEAAASVAISKVVPALPPVVDDGNGDDEPPQGEDPPQGPTDTEKAQAILDKITLSETTFNTLNEEVTLPTSDDETATVVWSVVKDGNTDNYVSITNNVLKIEKLPNAGGGVTVTLSVSVTVGEATVSKDTFTITIQPAPVVGPTDQDKADEVLESLNINNITKTYSETTSQAVQLPATGDLVTEYSATVLWAVEGTTNYVSVENNQLTVKELPEEEAATITLKVTVTVGTAHAEDTVTITLQPAAKEPEVDHDQEKANAALASLQEEINAINNKVFEEVDKAGTTVLPTTNETVEANGASVEWAIEGGTSEYVSIEGNKIHINKLPAYNTKDETVTLNVTVTVNGKTATGSITITVKQAPPTDEQKAQEVLDSLNINSIDKTYSEPTVQAVSLPTSTDYGATVVWTVEVGSGEIVTIADNNKLSVLKLPEGEDATITLKVTVTVNGASKTGTVTITVEKFKNDGTAAHPFTVAEVKEYLATLHLGNYEFTDKEIYVEGYVSTSFQGWSGANKNWYKVYIVDDRDEKNPEVNGFYIFKLFPDTEKNILALENDLSAGSKIIVYGYIQNYKGDNGNVLEMTPNNDKNPMAASYTDARSDSEKANAAIAAAKNAIDGKTIEDGVAEFTLPVSTVTGVTLTYTSSDATVAEDNSKVTVEHSTVATTVQINISAENGTEVTATLTVAETAPTDFYTASVVIEDYGTAHGWVNEDKYGEVVLDDNIKATTEVGSSNGKYYEHNTTHVKQWRLFESNDGELTITASNNAKIYSIKIVYSNGSDGCLYHSGKTVATDVEYVVNAASVTLTVKHSSGTKNGRVDITSIEVKYTGGKQMSDEERIAAALKELTIDTTELTADIDLPKTTVPGVTLAWEVTEGGTAAEVQGGAGVGFTLHITRGDADVPIKLKVTVSCGNAAAQEKTFENLTVKAKPAAESVIYKLVESDAQLVAGQKVLFVCTSKNAAGGAMGKDFITAVENIEITDSSIKDLGNIVAWTLQKNGTHWEFVNDEGGKLGTNAVKKVYVDNGTTTWDISIDASTHKATIESTNSSYGSLQYNASSPRFTTYTSSQTAIQLFIETAV